MCVFMVLWSLRAQPAMLPNIICLWKGRKHYSPTRAHAEQSPTSSSATQYPYIYCSHHLLPVCLPQTITLGYFTSSKSSSSRMWTHAVSISWIKTPFLSFCHTILYINPDMNTTALVNNCGTFISTGIVFSNMLPAAPAVSSQSSFSYEMIRLIGCLHFSPWLTYFLRSLEHHGEVW